MQINTARYVNSSELFSNFADIKQHFDQGSNFNFSWGDNNHSMIDKSTLIDALDQNISTVPASEIEPQAIPDGMSQETAEEVFLPQISDERWEEFKAHVGSLPDDVYIDLEN